MRNLFSANIRRLLKTAYFRIAAVILAAIGLFEITMVYMDFRTESGTPVFDSPLSSIAPLTAIAIAAVVSLYVGSEYSDGTIRNKIIGGHSRVAVLLSLLLTTVVGGWILAAVWSTAYLVPGVFLLESGNPPIMYVKLYLVTFLLLSVFSAIFTFVSIIIGNKAIAAVVCLLLVVLLMFQGMVVKSMLDEPEFYSPDYIITEESGEVQMGDPEPNPNYMPEGSMKRQVCEFLDDFTPGGQSVNLMGKLADRTAKVCSYNLVWIIVLSGVGLPLFHRKDLK